MCWNEFNSLKLWPLFFFSLYWRLNHGWSTTELHFTLFMLRKDLIKQLRLALNLWSSYFSLPIHWDYTWTRAWWHFMLLNLGYEGRLQLISFNYFKILKKKGREIFFLLFVFIGLNKVGHVFMLRAEGNKLKKVEIIRSFPLISPFFKPASLLPCSASTVWCASFTSGSPQVAPTSEFSDAHLAQLGAVGNSGPFPGRWLWTRWLSLSDGRALHPPRPPGEATTAWAWPSPSSWGQDQSAEIWVSWHLGGHILYFLHMQ